MVSAKSGRKFTDAAFSNTLTGSVQDNESVKGRIIGFDIGGQSDPVRRSHIGRIKQRIILLGVIQRIQASIVGSSNWRNERDLLTSRIEYLIRLPSFPIGGVTNVCSDKSCDTRCPVADRAFAALPTRESLALGGVGELGRLPSGEFCAVQLR